MLLEVCASNYKSAYNAQLAGADRIELCSELTIGGITPSYGLLKKVTGLLEISVFVLVRPRSGDFTYTEEEFEIMKANIELCKQLGVSGIVSGVLNIDNTIDVKRTQELVELSKPLPFTFHRAFDWTPNAEEALEQLIEIGVNRVLTSGQETSSEKGIDRLIKLQAQANKRITILPGGGINANNAKEFKNNGFLEVHASASTSKSTIVTPKISMNSIKFLSDDHIFYSDTSKIQAILNAVK
jgi:copper homeostasis protein